MNLHRIAAIAGVAFSLSWAPAPAQSQESATITRNRVERIVDGTLPGFKVGENILLFPEVANPKLLLDPAVVALYQQLLEKSKVSQISIYAFEHDVIQSKKGVWYVVKVDFISWNSGGDSVYYFVTSRPNITRLTSDNLVAALKEAKKL